MCEPGLSSKERSSQGQVNTKSSSGEGNFYKTITNVPLTGILQKLNVYGVFIIIILATECVYGGY